MSLSFPLQRILERDNITCLIPQSLSITFLYITLFLFIYLCMSHSISFYQCMSHYLSIYLPMYVPLAFFFLMYVPLSFYLPIYLSFFLPRYFSYYFFLNPLFISLSPSILFHSLFQTLETNPSLSLHLGTNTAKLYCRNCRPLKRRN